MSRYRPPGEKSSPYITPQGHKRLSEELEYLWRTRRPAVVAALSEAAAEGDRSENAEYIYRKKELREIDRRVRYLSKRVEELKIASGQPDDPGRVFFGAWITVMDDEAREQRYRIVGPDEIDAKQRLISIDSPLARALLGKSVDDCIEVPLPRGTVSLEIVGIDYEA